MAEERDGPPGAERADEILWARDLPFGFHLWRTPKQVSFGRASVQQFWMKTATLYGQRGKYAPNLQPMADYFWMRCCLGGTHLDPATQESYLLAHLCPHVRGSAAQKVFPDARLSRPGGSSAARRRDADELEPLLADLQRSPHLRERQLTRPEFAIKTGALVGMPEYSQEEHQAYRELCGELFGVARRVLIDRGPVATDLVIETWQEMTRRIGRRSGGTVRLKKAAMSALTLTPTGRELIWGVLARAHRRGVGAAFPAAAGGGSCRLVLLHRAAG